MPQDTNWNVMLYTKTGLEGKRKKKSKHDSQQISEERKFLI